MKFEIEVNEYHQNNASDSNGVERRLGFSYTPHKYTPEHLPTSPPMCSLPHPTTITNITKSINLIGDKQLRL